MNQFVMHLFIKEPHKLFGGGSYALSSVKQIDGTDAFLKYAETTRICQNKETVEECVAKDFLLEGLARCNCTLYRLRNYTRQVKYYLIFKNNKIRVKTRSIFFNFILYWD